MSKSSHISWSRKPPAGFETCGRLGACGGVRAAIDMSISWRNRAVISWPMLVVAMCWGINVPLVKVVLREFPPLAFGSLRYLLATILLVGLAWVREGGLYIKSSDWGRLFVLGVLGHFLNQVGFILGIAFTTASNTTLIRATTPVWVALLGALLNIERLSKGVWAGVALSFLGIGLIVQGSNGLSLHLAATWRGDLIALAGTLCWSLYNVWLRPMVKRYSPLWLTALGMGIGTPFLLGIAVPEARAQDWGEIGGSGWGILVYSAVFALVVGHSLWNTFVRRIGPARTAVYANLVPVISVSISWVFLGERWVPVQIVGAGLVFAGLYLTGRKRASSDAGTQYVTTDGEELRSGCPCAGVNE